LKKKSAEAIATSGISADVNVKTTEAKTPEKEKVSESSPSAADYQKQVLEEHELMRNIPVLEDIGSVKVDESGVKEYQGPPLPSETAPTETTKAEAKDAPAIDAPSSSSNINIPGYSATPQATAAAAPPVSAASDVILPGVPASLTAAPQASAAAAKPSDSAVPASASSKANDLGILDNLPNIPMVTPNATPSTAAAPAAMPIATATPAPLPTAFSNDNKTQITPAAPARNQVQVQAGMPPFAGGLPPLPQTGVSASSGPGSAAVPETSPKVMDKSLPPLPPLAPEKNTVNLTGSALGKEEVVGKILDKADVLVAEKEKKNQEVLEPLSDLGITTAGEKFITSRSTIEDFLTIAIEKNASDLHISTGYPPILRVDGRLVSLGGQDMTLERTTDLFTQLLTPRLKQELEKYMDVDFSHTHKTNNRFRVNIFHKKDTLAGAFRLIPLKIKSISELSMPPILYDLIKVPQGLILLTGPTGSGKSTTIAGMIQEINANYAKHIITVEDPIEYVFPRAKSIVDQREIGTDTIGWKRALREVLRQDPNVVLVGEMRDYETIAATITVAETGHLVFSTLHTNSASQTIDRMIDVFPAAQQSQIRAQLANVVTAVISQRLIPVNKGGRKAVVELMVATPAIRNAIREAKTYQIDNIIQTSADVGMITLEKSLVSMIRSGDLSVEQAQSYTTKPDELTSLLKTQ